MCTTKPRWAWSWVGGGGLRVTSTTVYNHEMNSVYYAKKKKKQILFFLILLHPLIFVFLVGLDNSTAAPCGNTATIATLTIKLQHWQSCNTDRDGVSSHSNGSRECRKANGNLLHGREGGGKCCRYNQQIRTGLHQKPSSTKAQCARFHFGQQSLPAHKCCGASLEGHVIRQDAQFLFLAFVTSSYIPVYTMRFTINDAVFVLLPIVSEPQDISKMVHRTKKERRKRCSSVIPHSFASSASFQTYSLLLLQRLTACLCCPM